MSHRNEPARSRRRSLLKQQLSLRSVPLVEAPSETYNLENHFGWKVLQKCRVNEGSFPPYLLHCIYCDKPDVPTRADGDQDKVMYVLYIRGKDGDMDTLDAKETQTSVQEFLHEPIPEPIHESIHKVLSTMIEAAPPAPPPKVSKGKGFRKTHDRRKIISDFYYIPIEDRVLLKVEGKMGDIGDKNTYKKGKKKKGSKGRSSPRSWQLRAGAENPCENEGTGDTTDASDISSDEESESEEEDETEREFIDLKKSDCTPCFSKMTNVELMESPMERNKYLYLPKERYVKRSHNISGQETGNNK